ncbi:hypothetical protein [Hyphomonas sp.]|uniref:hypothetical protein n=1 Tax=Hyphomonas sp. TaxID=87 RepID=UPI0035627880
MRRGLLPRILRFQAIAGVMLVALLVRAAVPTGWMAAPSADGGFTIALCSGRTVTLDLQSRRVAGLDGDDQPADSGQDGDHSDPSHMPPCAFAVASILDQAGQSAAFVAPVVLDAADRSLPQTRAPPAARTITAPLPARGPPLFT